MTDWDAVRADYEGGNGNTTEIARRHGVSSRSLQYHALGEGWTRRNRRHQIDRGVIINRMFHLLERQILSLEEDMKQTGEKEVAVLGKLAGTLEKLIEIDNAEPKPGAPRVQTEEMKELRHRLAQRIAQLKRP